ncbi:zinc carboxypeptidase [Herbihabitans rhizosphaerae]|uniref:Zinc carboxypeptidase n=1 Tax=Herbihabitans rhizosphaerae TaxID=1872711 RepID=A0A4Q7KTP5_9PSEU|nr:M14 family zinc carboxypeptidase [Herbihabitans rhizosphaerae]RZS38822.1 zinc carboxypeptidase [Herbihabitans rhizosphaerae]
MRTFSVLAALTAVTAATLTLPADAAVTQDVDPRPSNEKLAEMLADLAETSAGRITVRDIGRSNENRPVWAARVGEGLLRIQYVTQQHGDEPLGTPAAVEFLREVGAPDQEGLRSKVTIEVIVRDNPDGHQRDWRYNYAPDADPEFGEKGKGYDLNRYHNPDVAPDDNPATEAGHIQRAYAEFKPEIVIDYHMQGDYRPVTASVMWPTHPDVTPEAVNAAKQVTVVAQRAIDGGGGNVSQYPGGDYEGIARNAYGLRGSASVLLELSDMGAGHEQAQIRSAQAAMRAVAQAAADGSLEKVDPADADKIPQRPAVTGDNRRVDDAGD